MNRKNLIGVLACVAAGCGLGPPGAGGDELRTGGGAGGGAGRHACGYVGAIRRVCSGDGFVRHLVDSSQCHDDWSDAECTARTPVKPDYDDGACYENYLYTPRPFEGTCLQWRQYHDEQTDASGRRLVECLYDAHCPETASGRCVDFRCVCDGPCPKPGPPPPPGPR